MAMFPAGVRVEDHPEQWLPVSSHPEVDRARVAEILRARREPVVRADWPAPEVPMRIVEPGSLKSGPARLLRSLRAAEWRSVVTYARGTIFDAQKRPGAVVSSWAIRAAKGNRRIVAIWWERTPGKLESKGVLVWGDRPAVWLGLREFEREIW